MQVDTGIGPVHVEVVGAGPAAVLWHSLFLDSRQWDRVRDPMAAHRTLVLIDGPGHGRGGLPPHRFTFDDCADAAALVLGALGLGQDVDWVGNAWGGHVGYAYASRYPARSLVTIGAPPTPLPPAERRRIALLIAAYRAVGPRPLTGAVVAALLGPDADAHSVAMVRDTFRTNDRTGMQRVMRAMMLQRPDSPTGPIDLRTDLADHWEPGSHVDARPRGEGRSRTPARPVRRDRERRAPPSARDAGGDSRGDPLVLAPDLARHVLTEVGEVPDTADSRCHKPTLLQRPSRIRRRSAARDEL